MNLRFASPRIAFVVMPLMVALIAALSINGSGNSDNKEIVTNDSIALMAAITDSSNPGTTSKLEADSCQADHFFWGVRSMKGPSGKDRPGIGRMEFTVRHTKANPNLNRLCVVVILGGLTQEKQVPASVTVVSYDCKTGANQRRLSWDWDTTVSYWTFGRAGTPGEGRCGYIQGSVEWEGTTYRVRVSAKQYPRLFRN